MRVHVDFSIHTKLSFYLHHVWRDFHFLPLLLSGVGGQTAGPKAFFNAFQGHVKHQNTSIKSELFHISALLKREKIYFLWKCFDVSRMPQRNALKGFWASSWASPSLQGAITEIANPTIHLDKSR